MGKRLLNLYFYLIIWLVMYFASSPTSHQGLLSDTPGYFVIDFVLPYWADLILGGKVEIRFVEFHPRQIVILVGSELA